MEEFVAQLLKHENEGGEGQGVLGDKVEGVWDMNLDYIVPSSSLFSLLPKRVPAPSTSTLNPGTNSKTNGTGNNGKEKEVDAPGGSYRVFNDPRSTEGEVEEEAERVAKGLMSVVVTMGAYLSFSFSLSLR